ncbi:phospholipase [Roseiconus nitratireducens]|uniref:Phospholipase n=1 Tax=Roseiconus nitratireducens TaxID=2605748 RepID=A0A5M6DKU9_9BACT|nr:phospholipase [Roseiconus nitratireducens]KAA5545965.1 phospholipase [Roseiconus nitratireducens]
MALDQKTQFPSDLLRRLHSLHSQVADLEGQLERAPRQIRAGENLVAEATAALQKARDDVKSATVACDEKQLQLKSREDRIEDLKAKLNTAASNKEYNLLKEQIAADQQANSVQSDEILEALERIDELNATVKQAEATLKQKTEEHQKRVKEIENRTEVVRGDLEYIHAELEKAEKEIPATARSEYRRLYESRGDEFLAPVEEGSCGGCNQTLTTQMLDRLRLQFLVECPACAAWLYVK